MEICLIRHTTPNVEQGTCYGQSDLDITETFSSEAKEVQKKLNTFNPCQGTVFYSSPLQRCRKLAEAITTKPITCDDRLMEMHFGTWEMQKWDDIDPKALRHWTDDYVNVPCPKGESYQQFYQRVELFINELKSQPHQKSIIVTHGGVIRCFFSYLGITTLKNSFEKKVDYGDVFQLSL